MTGLDTLWFQVAGTLCNLRCTHCFVSCAPDNQSHGMMSLSEVLRTRSECVGGAAPPQLIHVAERGLLQTRNRVVDEPDL